MKSETAIEIAPQYRRFNSYGFLKLYRKNSDGTYTQIGGTALPGMEGVKCLDEIQRQDQIDRAAALTKATNHMKEGAK